MSAVRRDQPRVGTKKLYNHLQPQLKAAGVTIGRDKLHDMLTERDMLIRRKKRSQKTTYSRHQYAISPNRVKDVEIERPNQVLASDITYITLQKGFAYLFLTTDLFSRKIVGYHLSRDLSHHSALISLDMALRDIADPDNTTHHSDRGCQYCCHEFLDYLASYGTASSMTDASHCYQNAIAERVNGILKDELNLDAVFPNFEDAKQAVEKAIHIYNSVRTHWSLELKTPNEVYSLAA